jgi:putative endonuclease
MARLRALARGNEAEVQAVDLVRNAGLAVLARNARFRGGELDLVALDGEHLVIIEVRSRAPSRYGGAAESITPRKQARLMHAALAWMQAHPDHQHRPLRFDVVAFDGDGPPSWIRHAFDA